MIVRTLIAISTTLVFFLFLVPVFSDGEAQTAQVLIVGTREARREGGGPLKRGAYRVEVAPDEIKVSRVFPEGVFVNWESVNARGQGVWHLSVTAESGLIKQAGDAEGDSEKRHNEFWYVDLISGERKAINLGENNIGVVCRGPISPQGELFAFIEPDQNRELYVVDLKAETIKALLTGTERFFPLASGWSPNGSLLAISTSGRLGTVRIVKAIGGAVEFEFCAEGPVSPASWSPDGNAIAYYFGSKKSSGDDSFRVGVATKTAQGWTHKEVAPASLLGMFSPARRKPPVWSTEGGFLLFTARYEAGSADPVHSPYVVSRDGNWLKAVSALDREDKSRKPAGDYIITTDDKGVWCLAFPEKKVRKVFDRPRTHFIASADGRFIAFAGDGQSVYVANWDGAGEREVTGYDENWAKEFPLTWLTINKEKRGESHSGQD